MEEIRKLGSRINKTIVHSENLRSISNMDLEGVFKYTNSCGNGLTKEEASSRLLRDGKNEILYKKKKKWYNELISAFLNPFNLVILTLALVSVITDVILAKESSYKTVIILTLMVLLGGLLKFLEEHKSRIASENLKDMIKTTIAVERNGSLVVEENIKELVVGDVIHLSAGDMIPADMRVILSKDLFISQSALTGESEPIEKRVTPKVATDENTIATDIENILLQGTNIVSGSGVGIVIGTGEKTYLGSMKEIFQESHIKSAFEKGIDAVSKLLIKFMVVMVPVVFLLNYFFKGNLLESILFSISVAVGLTPEMLPMIVTTNLAKGALALSKKRTIVKKLESIQNFGAMDILCTDKTGTLTLDRIVVQRYMNVEGVEDNSVLKHAYLNSYFQTGLRNLMDRAIIDKGNVYGMSELHSKYIKDDEIPFDFNRRRMSVILEHSNSDSGKKQEVITKGAVEEILAICTNARVKGIDIPLTDQMRESVMKSVEEFSKNGMRVVAVAERKLEEKHHGNFQVSDECEMTLLGYIGFLDPPKDDVADAIKALKKSGVSVKILTGDNEYVSMKVCSDVGLEVDEILLGSQMEKLSLEELKVKVSKVTLFAKVSPLQKATIVKTLQSLGHTVGFMGDGINDSGALKQADVGISVDTGVDIAKESADIILLEKDLMILDDGIIEGRRIFGNITKYIKMTASSNFGNMFSVIIASAFLPFLPMLPIHLLIQNLLYDFSQVSIPWDSMDSDFLKVPRKWDSSDLKRFMLWIGPLSSVFDVITFLVLYYVFSSNSVETGSLFQSGWFIEGLLTQTLIVHMIRTEKIPFIQSKATTPVILTTIAVITLGMYIPYSAFGKVVGFVPLPFMYFIYLFTILICYFLLVLLVKKIYIKKYNKWL